MPLGQIKQRRDQPQQQPAVGRQLAAQPQPQIKGHLIVTTAGGMQLFAGRADFGGQQSFDIHMDILGRGIEGDLTGLDLGQQLLQAVLNQPRLLCIEDAAGFQHAGMGQRTDDILTVQALIETDRRMKAFRRRIRFAAETAAP